MKGFGKFLLLMFLLATTWLAAGCDGDSSVKVTGANVPTINARVLTVRTTIPDEEAILSAVVIAEGKVRLGVGTERWRLFDFNGSTVTFVDDVARTYRTETLAELTRKRLAMLTRPLPAGLARATFTKTGSSRTFSGIPAEHYMIQMGGYKRELWLSTTPLVAPQFLSMMIVSDPLDPTSAPVMSEVQSQLAKLQGFPVYERSQMPYGEKPLIMEKALVKIEQKPVPRSWITIPDGYRDLSVKESSGGQQPAS